MTQAAVHFFQRHRLGVLCRLFLLFATFSAGYAFPPSHSCWIARGGENSVSRATAVVARNLSSTVSTTTNSISPSNSDGTPEWTLRGGGDDDEVDQGSLCVAVNEKEIIQTFLRSRPSDATALDNFHIQGWRWHTKSLIREVGRLHTLALKSNLQDVKTLQEATEYVIGFNMKGLHKIEADLFFPWMRRQLTSVPANKDLARSFGVVMDELEMDRVQVAQLGKTISKNVALACDSSRPESLRRGAIETVADQTAKLQLCARNMMDLEDTYLVPAVAALVPEGEQKSFNNKVLRGLGLWDSRLHLVSMYEAVWEDKNNQKEQELFRKAIPSVPQMMIPRWNRKLYSPKTYMLD